MRKAIRLFVLFSIVSSVAASSGVVRAADDVDARVSNAWQALLSGKAVALMRHAIAPGIGDPADFELEDCATQRNLSDAGRTQAVAIGDALRANGVAEATILSSQWCRCLETARLLNLGDPEPVEMLNSFFENRGRADEQTQTLRESLSESLALKDEVRVLVTHQVNISALTGQFTGSGDMLIVTMDDDEFVVLAIISTD